MFAQFLGADILGFSEAVLDGDLSILDKLVAEEFRDECRFFWSEDPDMGIDTFWLGFGSVVGGQV